MRSFVWITYHVFTVDALDFLLPHPVIESDLAGEELFSTPLNIGFKTELLLVERQSVLIWIDWSCLGLVFVSSVTLRRLLLSLPDILMMLRVESKFVFTFFRWEIIIVKHCGRLHIFLTKVLRLSRIFIR